MRSPPAARLAGLAWPFGAAGVRLGTEACERVSKWSVDRSGHGAHQAVGICSLSPSLPPPCLWPEARHVLQGRSSSANWQEQQGWGNGSGRDSLAQPLSTPPSALVTKLCGACFPGRFHIVCALVHMARQLPSSRSGTNGGHMPPGKGGGAGGLGSGGGQWGLGSGPGGAGRPAPSSTREQGPGVGTLQQQSGQTGLLGRARARAGPGSPGAWIQL